MINFLFCFDESINGMEINIDMCNFPSQATENWSSPSLRSGEALNFSECNVKKIKFVHIFIYK